MKRHKCLKNSTKFEFQWNHKPFLLFAHNYTFKFNSNFISRPKKKEICAPHRCEYNIFDIAKIFVFFSFYFRVEESTDLGNAIQCLEAYDFKAEDNNEFLTLVFISFILYNLIRFDTETAVSVVPSRCTMHIYTITV